MFFYRNPLKWVQDQKVVASGDANPAGDNFGYSVALNSTGDVLAISSYSDEDIGGEFAGSVYIFQSSSLGYQQIQKIAASGDADPSWDVLGFSLSLNSAGDKLVVGTIFDEENGDRAGSVYIFQSSSLGYQQVQKLTASGDADPAFDYFGASLSLNSAGDVLVVGASNDEENGTLEPTWGGAGSVYVFQSSSLGYQQVQKLTASGDVSYENDNFGISVSLNSTGDKLVVGSSGDEAAAGSVYVFQSSSLGYQQIQKLTASGDAHPGNDNFGVSLSLNSTGDKLVVGAIGDEENGGNFAGSVYIFQSGSTGYQQVQELTASGDANPADDKFGFSVSLNSTGDKLVIGASGDEENGGASAGSVYVFQSSSLGYQQIQKLTAGGDVNPGNDNFGVSLSLNSTGDVLVVGANYDEENGTDGTDWGGAGSAYIFKYTRDY